MMMRTPTKLLFVNMRRMRASAKGSGASPSVYISVTTCPLTLIPPSCSTLCRASNRTSVQTYNIHRIFPLPNSTLCRAINWTLCLSFYSNLLCNVQLTYCTNTNCILIAPSSELRATPSAIILNSAFSEHDTWYLQYSRLFLLTSLMTRVHNNRNASPLHLHHQRAKEFTWVYQNDVAVLWMLSDKRKEKTGEVLREVKKWCMCAGI